MRQFIAETELSAQGCLTIEGKNFHYISNVLRASLGDMVSVRLLDGKLQSMTVAKIDQKKKQIVLQVAGANVTSVASEKESFHAKAEEKKSSLELWLFQFVAKPVKMELIIRQAVECGVSVVVPVAGTFCQSGAVKSAEEAALKSGKGGRWDRIVTEALQQSGSPVVTKINKCVTVKEAIELWQSEANENKAAVVLYEQTNGTVPLKAAVSRKSCVKKVAVAVGAEGGISPEEVALLKEGGFIPVHLQTNILRCETAALYGLAVVQNLLTEDLTCQSKE